MSKRVAIVDYGVGNLFSVKQACEHVGLAADIVSTAQAISTADAVILPGVGAFGYAMDRLRDHQLLSAVKDAGLSGKPFMGVCLGFQLLFDKSAEIGSHEGLGLVKGEVGPLVGSDAHATKFRTPIVSWLPISSSARSWKGTGLHGVMQGSEMYFVHSFAATPENPDDILATTTCQGVTYCCAIQRDNLFGCQFHPEKSGQAGLAIYRRFEQSIAAR